MLSPTPDRFRSLARSSPWRWRALAFDLHRRPSPGPEHTVHAVLERGVGLEVRLADGGHHRDPAVRWPMASTSDDPMWGDHQWVAMLDPVELADGSPCAPGLDPGVKDAVCPPALDVHRLDATLRHGRETWWAEVSPREEYSPRCSCCPLLVGRVSEEIDAEGGSTLSTRQPGLVYATAYLVALDVGTGICVHVEHLDGDHVGRGFSVDIRAVDGSRALQPRDGWR